MTDGEKLTAGVAHIAQKNKKLYSVTLRDGQSLQLMLQDMFTVQLIQQGQMLLNVRFQPLSSLNNLEMPPVYRVAHMQMDQRIDGALGDELLICVFTVYRYYTRGSIHPWRPSIN